MAHKGCMHDDLPHEVTLLDAPSGDSLILSTAVVDGVGSHAQQQVGVRVPFNVAEEFVNFTNPFIQGISARAKQWAADTLSAKSPSPLGISRRCLEVWGSGINAGKCKSLEVPTCLGVPIPNRFLFPQVWCTTADDPASCVSAGSAPVQADLLLMVTHLPCQPRVLAYASACYLGAPLDRPVLGLVNYCPLVFSQPLNDAVDTAIHELTHVLGFSSNLFPYFRHRDGSPRTVRDASGRPAGPGSSTVARTVVRDKPAWLLRTEAVVTAARRHFSCDALEGAELEDFRGTERPSSHWEQRVFFDEYMTSIDSPVPAFSHLTLAFLEDTGWYTVNDTTVTDLTWGLNEGCDFSFKKCISPAISTSFCEENEAIGCSVGRYSVGRCRLFLHNEELPRAMQYFPNPRAGGREALDYCPVYEYSQQEDCRVAANAKGFLTFDGGQGWGPSSRCFESSLTKSGRQLGAGCYNYRCSSKGVLQVKVGSSFYNCDDHSIKVPGYAGELVCPAALTKCEPNTNADSDDDGEGGGGGDVSAAGAGETITMLWVAVLCLVAACV